MRTTLRLSLLLRHDERGTAITEFAIMAPILVSIVLWSIYFWEVQEARIKAAEAARFAAFEMTVGRSPAAIADDAKKRFADLDSTTKTGTLGTAWFNKLTIQKVQVQEAGAPLASPSLNQMGNQAGGLGSILSTATSLVGNSVDKVIGVLGFKVDRGAAQSSVEFKMENRIIPERIGDYMAKGNLSLDLTFKDSYFVYYDTWRAWQPGDKPSQTMSVVQSRTQQRVKKVAYLGLMSSAAAGPLNAVGNFLSLFKLDWPLSTSYINDSVLIKKPLEPGRYPAVRNTRTTPGDILQAVWWTNDERYCYGGSCSGSWWGGGRDELAKNSGKLRYKRGLQTVSGGDNIWDNWPMRSYNCRGNFFEGASRSTLIPVEYFGARGSPPSNEAKNHFVVGSRACVNKAY